MKNVFIVFFLCFFAIHSNAQMSVKMGDLKYKITNYRGAAKSYKRYLNDVENQYDIPVIRKLAYAYQKSNQSVLAELTFAKLTIMDSSFADIVAYSDMLLKNKKYDTLNKFLRSKPELLAKNDARISNILNTVKNVNQLVSLDTGNIRISKLNLNTSNTDFAPSFFQNGIIFSSNRISNGFLKSKKTKTNKQIAGLYFSNSDDGFKAVKSFASNLKIKGNYSNASYHAKTRTLFYSANKNPKNVNSTEKDINIYLAKLDVLNDKWLKGPNFPFNSPKYSNTTPFVNQEGTELYFSSNMTGGYGGFDIYVSFWKDSAWTIPQNMGSKVNSAGDEMYPFVDNTNLLHYSSNGKGGLGGMDIFTYDLNNPNALAENLGAPYNSNTDDLGFIKYANSEKGYFSSARASNGNEFDIYTFTRLKPTTKNFRIDIVDAKSNTGINGVSLTVKSDEGTKVIDNVQSFQRFEKVEPGKKYSFTAAASNYEPTNLEVLVNRIDTLYEMRLNRLRDGCSVQGKVVDKTSAQALANVKIKIRNEFDSTEVYTVYTDKNGVYSIKGLKKSSNYTFTVELENYFPSLKNLKTLSTCIPLNNTFDYTQDFKLISGSIVQIDSIYFDFNRWEIRKDAAKELDKIVKFMKENPEVVVELYSHTDSRGTDKINMAISQRRANNSVRYITSKGISKKRITGKGFGASKLLNNCTSDVICTEDQHQINRRTEMKVVNVIDVR